MTSIRLPGYSDLVLVDSIIWLKGEGSYTRIYFRDKPSSMATQPLVWFEHHLDFIRINRSTLVNQKYIHTFHWTGNRSGEIQLVDGTALSVSRSRLDYLTAILKTRMIDHTTTGYQTHEYNGLLACAIN